MASLAGEWRDPQGNALFIQGREPTYTFHTSIGGITMSQGVINRTSQGKWLATGQGINGPVRTWFWLSDPNTLQGQNDVLVDGGMIDGIMKAFMPQLGAVQPVFTLQRQYAVEEEEKQVADREAQKKALAALETIAAAAEEARKQEVARKEAEERRIEDRRKKSDQQDENTEEDPMDELKKLIGMKEVKSELENLEAWAWRQRQLKEQGLKAESPSMHMSFTGGPGTGKTTIARIIGRLLKKYGLLEHGLVNEMRRADLVGEFIGQTAPKTEKAIEESLGGVLFIDEAYALSEPGAGGGNRDYGAEALTTLIAGMENHRSRLCVIVAGYPEEMKRFIDANAGLASRISRHIAFPDYSEQELQQILEKMASRQNLVLDPNILRSFQAGARKAKLATSPRQWGNARWVRNILERGIESQSLRLRKLNRKPTRKELLKLEASDFDFMIT